LAAHEVAAKRNTALREHPLDKAVALDPVSAAMAFIVQFDRAQRFQGDRVQQDKIHMLLCDGAKRSPENLTCALTFDLDEIGDPHFRHDDGAASYASHERSIKALLGRCEKAGDAFVLGFPAFDEGRQKDDARKNYQGFQYRRY
jgi:hypothetical protein